MSEDPQENPKLKMNRNVIPVMKRSLHSFFANYKKCNEF